jgi:hypothetical protein
MKTLGVLVLVVWLLGGVLQVGAEPFGVGIMVGEPTGLSFKQWVSSTTAFAAGAAWSFEGDPAFHIHMDYILHRPRPVELGSGRWFYYFGLGGRIKLEENDSRIGPRLPLGIEYMFDDAPVDLFFEVAPGMDLAPDTEFRMNGGLGIRYFFD